jgi:hypothetical protein
MAFKLFNLISGQECLADIEEETKTSYICKSILQLIPDPQQGGVAMIGFPMFKEGSGTTEIGKDKLICVSEPLQELINQYNQQTGTGIVTPPKQGLTLTK